MTTQEAIVDFEKETIEGMAKRVGEESLFTHKRYAPTKLQISTEKHDSGWGWPNKDCTKDNLTALSKELAKYFDKDSIKVEFLQKDCCHIRVTNPLIED